MKGWRESRVIQELESWTTTARIAQTGRRGMRLSNSPANMADGKIRGIARP
jgi:hypothetical protein